MRKHIHLTMLIFLLFPVILLSQEQKEVIVKSEVSEATVFINGAQVLRKKAVDLLPGKSKIRFTNLSPYIDAKSVQVKMDGEVMVMSVNHQSNFDTLKQAVIATGLGKQLEDILDKIAIEKTNKEIIKEELNFLNENKKIGGSNTGVSLVTLRETANYYRDRIAALKLKDIELNKKIDELERQRDAIYREQNQQGTTKISPIGEVVIEVETKKTVRANVELTYYVNNAGWFPTYDIRAINVDKPIQLIYKANIRQNTKEDWKNIKLKVSSADPNTGNVVPQLKTYFLNYYTAPPRYNTQVDNNQVSGVVLDEQNETVIGASVVVKGTTIGTITDLDGRFSLAIPQNGKELTISFIGYESQTLPITNSYMNVRLKENANQLDEVVVVGYGTSKKQQLTGAVSGIQVKQVEKSKPAVPEFKRADIAMPTAQVTTQTTVEFEIKTPYSIKSDNKNTIIEVDRYELPADYEYFAIPKISKDAFLLANITDWEKYNLLDGEANIFFENTYIGKTILDTRNTSDTLNISLGKDKSIMVNREKGKDYSSKKFLGSKKEDIREWKISIRNNKNQAINFVLLDQIPVSTISEIEVESENLSGGALNAETGEVKWNMELKPSDRKEIVLKYKVKSPRSRNLTVE
ncbi:hypothetical protein GGR21_003804 [Dysgonomonas hofstadii]|uniref:Mucoidy inhibitor MuiA family protein n=1 Tax=Dysgonomonas hofstadii TaxID=637886 RepID=A0A840D0Q1_9BACT|nr:DUF4139 domain-containing protein [Dysgonomonas hofstadii]MBB4037883.1 hypothetical protein [Dysgonomonas hofstadii]